MQYCRQSSVYLQNTTVLEEDIVGAYLEKIVFSLFFYITLSLILIFVLDLCKIIINIANAAESDNKELID